MTILKNKSELEIAVSFEQLLFDVITIAGLIKTELKQKGTEMDCFIKLSIQYIVIAPIQYEVVEVESSNDREIANSLLIKL